MNRLLLTTVCASIVFCGVMNAQARPLGPDPHDRPRHEMKMHHNLADKLNLTDEQKIKADKIREDGREKMKPLMQEKKALREKMDKLRKENMAEFEKILTPEQKAEFAKIKEEDRHDPRRMPYKRGPRPEPEMMPAEPADK